MNKGIIRQSLLNKLKAQKEESRRQKSLAIKKRLFNLTEFKRAKKILLYFGKRYEVDTADIIKKALQIKKRIFLPVTDITGKKLMISEISDIQKDTEAGPWGIYQPKAICAKKTDTCMFDLIIVPGIGFDKKGNRLGHGGGYYDRFLNSIPDSIPRIGLAFDFQMLDDSLPTLAHDIPVTKVITN